MMLPTNETKDWAGDTPTTPKQLHPMEELGIEYHVATETFDRRICENWREGREAIPRDAWEREQCSRNAMYETHKAQKRAEQIFGIHAGREMIKWIQRTAGHPEVARRLSAGRGQPAHPPKKVK